MTPQVTEVQTTFGGNGGKMTGKDAISFEKQVAEIYETAALPLSYHGLNSSLIYAVMQCSVRGGRRFESSLPDHIPLRDSSC